MAGTRSALIVASDDYADPGLRRLRAPASDAQALEVVLRDPGIGGFEVRTLLNEPAHVVNLAVEEFFADRRPGDLLLMHFSGHGIKDQDGELYFAASNTLLGRLGATAVAAEFVSRRMTRGRSRRVVLLLDCCYAGAFERGLVARAGTELGIEQQFGGRGRAVITASSAMEYAFEAGELADTHQVPPSVFTSALVEGLATGEADRDQDGLVGLDELYDYVYDKVRAVTPNQTPGKWTFGMEGELYIARRSRPVTTPAPLPPKLQQAIGNPLAGIRAEAVQELAGMLRGKHPGRALAARLALERLTEDDSRTVAAAAIAALGGMATIRVHAQVDPVSLPASKAAVTESRAATWGGAGPDVGRAAPPDINGRPAVSASRRKAPRALLSRRDGRTGRYRPVIIAAGIGIAVISVVIAITIIPGAPRVAGTVRWTYNTGDAIVSSPAVADGTVYIGSYNSKVYALDAATGHVRWTYTTGGSVGSGPAVAGGTVYVGSDDDKVYALDAATGRVRWAYTTGGWVDSTPAVSGGTVYVGSGLGVYALDAATGHLRWTSTPGGFSYSAPAVAAGTVYVGSGDDKVYALDATTGHLRWTYATAFGGWIRSGPAVSGGTVYIGTAADDRVYALDAANGHLRWTYTTGGWIDSSPAVSGGTVYIGSDDGKVYALDAATGHPRWTYTTEGSFGSGPAVSGGTVYIGSNNNTVYALDAATGHPRWTYITGDSIVSGPAVAGGTVYVGGADHKVYALDAR